MLKWIIRLPDWATQFFFHLSLSHPCLIFLICNGNKYSAIWYWDDNYLGNIKDIFPFLYPLFASFCPSSPSLSLCPSSLLPLSLHPSFFLSFFPLYLSFLFWERILPGLECFTFLSAGIIGMSCHCNILKLSGQGEFNSTAVSFSGICYHFNKPFHSPCYCRLICIKINICLYNKSLYRN